MTPSQMREVLLQDHMILRSMIAAARKVAERACDGQTTADELRGELVRLADVLRGHNLREEGLLRNVIPSVDAWGQARAEIMTEEHVREHEELVAALTGVQSTPVEFAGAGTGLLLDGILGHMAREESAFLGEDVLRDDIVATYSLSG
jgi:hypothetical protein